MDYKIKFPPMAIDGVLAMALQMVLGYSTPQYHYDKSGSTVEFTAQELKDTIKYLRDMRNETKRRNADIKDSPKDALEFQENVDSIAEIDSALETIRASVMGSSNIAQASRSDSVVKYYTKLAKLVNQDLQTLANKS